MATKLRKRDRIKAIFQHDEAQVSDSSGSSIASSPATKVPNGPIDTESSDTQRAKARYFEATKLLQEAIKQFSRSRGCQFEFAELTGEHDFNDIAFRETFNAALETFKPTIKDAGTWTKSRHALQSLFTALSPFAKNFLTIAVEGAAISILNPYGLLCGGLMLLITVFSSYHKCLTEQIGEQELSRKEELDNALDYFVQQLEELEVVSVLPDDIDQRDYILNRALDVRSASMLYLAVHLRHGATALGTLGRVFKTFFIGDEKITDSEKYLNASVASYGRALSSIHARVSIKSYELLKGLVALTAQHKTDERRPLEDKFLVPYQQNPRFTGRTKLLEALKDKMYTDVPRHFNHRVALYGIGGVGKTQCALEYAYLNRDVYERIYWIAATTQASLLSGFQRIAKKAQLPGLENATLTEIAETVLAWLRSEKSWLVVIDNLDDVTVVDGLLPENGPEKHTLITTRNPNTLGIPAEALEVPLLTAEDSIELFSVLSLVPIHPDTPEWQTAVEIVKELGYLPLAIEQAAAYVREISGDLKSYYEEYLENHKKLYSWVPSGNRQYSYSVATTWSMSFHVVRNSNPSAVRLLRLFSALNPDGILIQFLLDGVKGAGEDMQSVFSNRLEMARALLELEKFSLIKWDRIGKLVGIHRLIQTVVTDEMTSNELERIQELVINMSFFAFPESITPDSRPICRRYESQVVEALLKITGFATFETYTVKHRVARFLHDDGKYRDAERFSRQLISMTEQGPETPETVNNLMIYYDELAASYLNEGRMAEAARIRERVLEGRRKFTGEADPSTLVAINNLSLTYMYQDRLDEAIKLQEELVARCKRILGEESRNTLIFTDNLALSYVKLNRYKDAAKLQEDALGKSRKVFGEEDETTLELTHNLAMTYIRDGRLAKVEGMLRELLVSRSRILGEDHPASLETKHLLANTLRELRKPEEALPLAEEVLAKRSQLLGEKHQVTVNTMGLVGLIYRELGKVSELNVLEQRFLKAKSH